MQQWDDSWELPAWGRGIWELTGDLQDWLTRLSARQGWLLLFLPHTSASLALLENADPDVQADILDFLARLAPDGDPRYRHQNEGKDDMAAHLRSLLGGQSLQLPVREKRLCLGTWQGVYLLEHREQPRQRRLLLSFLGEIGS
ncbi:MAG: secondary thiamine-phosphate synthase enzyme YjbQ [Acidithiobacillus sp.]|nr:secondary thiamine-phosphate synthase enzyme YjbQ [Acidithiobacillus sp.]